MNNSIKKILNKLEKNGFEAYVVGGYVRDYLLNITSYDVDICTNALRKDIIKVFKIKKGVSNYGSIGFKIGKYNYDITTYREDGEYNNHKPKSIKYVDNLLIDLKRRDFRINSICMNSEGKIFDYLNGKEDIHNKLVKTIGSTNVRLYEDPVRILRAIIPTIDIHIPPSYIHKRQYYISQTGLLKLIPQLPSRRHLYHNPFYMGLQFQFLRFHTFLKNTYQEQWQDEHRKYISAHHIHN